jgi:hypothetical protein
VGVRAGVEPLAHQLPKAASRQSPPPNYGWCSWLMLILIINKNKSLF